MNNKNNLVYFEEKSMKELYDLMNDWQLKYQKRLLSINIQKDGAMFSCIGLTNPTEVVLCNSKGKYLSTGIDQNGDPALSVFVK